MHNLRIEALAFECNLQEFHLLIGFEDSDRCTALQLATVTPKSAK